MGICLFFGASYRLKEAVKITLAPESDKCITSRKVAGKALSGGGKNDRKAIDKSEESGGGRNGKEIFRLP